MLELGLQTMEAELALMKLSCVNCSAPLEIGDDLERFACSYCGTNQIVERAGGIVALKKVQTAIHAVQRGTDRTAAELALPRLNKELAEAQAARVAVQNASKEVMDRAKSGRKTLTIVTAFILFMVGPMGIISAANVSDNLAVALVPVWFISMIAIPIFVFRRVKLPADTSKEKLASADQAIDRIQKQIAANRAILDGAHD